MGWWNGEFDEKELKPQQRKCEKCGEASDVLEKWKHIDCLLYTSDAADDC